MSRLEALFKRSATMMQILYTQPAILTWIIIDNSVPSDSPASLFVEVSPSIRNAIIILASISMAITALCMVFVAYYRNDSTLKALQPLLLLGTLLGCMMCCSQMIMEAFPVTTTTCASRVWFVHLSFYLIMGSIVDANGLKKVSVSEMLVVNLFFGGLCCFVAYLIILEAAGAPMVGP